MNATPKSKIAVLICTNVIGGHEFQASAMVRDLREIAEVTVYVNDEKHVQMFAEARVDTVCLSGHLLKPGTLGKQVWNGICARKTLRKQLGHPDHVLICAGAVEAGVAASVALYGWVPLSLYLPFFYDRIPVWGKFGCLYNRLLSGFCALYSRIVTINRIQARVITRLTGIATVVVPNKVRQVAAVDAVRPGRLVFVGRLDHQKRIDELLTGIDFPHNPFGEILLIGDGPLRAKLESIAGRMEHVKVTFAGWLSADQQDALMDANDVLLLNSLLEGEPLVIREARKRGMRVLARAIIGVRGVTRRDERFANLGELRERLMQLPPARKKEVRVLADNAEDLRRARAVRALRFESLVNR
jgi:glycosyltransferase involved in cell wall biosynthesis